MVLDMDMFYAAVEIRDNPELKDLPVAVGDTYMISTSNYVARKYGVRAAIPGFIAKKLCPQLVFIPHHGEKYRQVGEIVRTIAAEYDPKFRSFSLDEVYMDITAECIRRLDVEAEEVTVNKKEPLENDKSLTATDITNPNQEEKEVDVSKYPLEQVRTMASNIIVEMRKKIETSTGGLTAS